MLKRTLCATAVAAALFATASAGVVISMVEKELPDGQSSQASKIYAQGTMLKVVPHSDEVAPELIFKNGVIYVVNHEQRNYFMMDQKRLEQLGSTLEAATRQFEEQLKHLPEDQRAAALEMMKRMGGGQLPPGMGGDKPEPLRLEPAGNETVGSYRCKLYGVYRGAEKQMEICAASDVGAAGEAMPAFREMAKFFDDMLESLKTGPLSQMAESPYQLIGQVDGFPVLTRHFENGRAVRETTLEGAESQNLAPTTFDPPSDYDLADPFKQMPRR